MDKYYLIHIQIMNDGTQAQSVFAYDDRTSAISAFHSTLASDYASQSLKAFTAMVINYHGGTEAREYWDAPAPVDVAED